MVQNLPATAATTPESRLVDNDNQATSKLTQNPTSTAADASPPSKPVPNTHKLFQPATIAGLSLQSRVVMAPMTRYQANSKCLPTETMVQYYAKRAEEGVGLILSEGTLINNSGKVGGSGEVPVFFGEEALQGWKKIVDAVHEKNGKFFPQLWHCGRFARDAVGPVACPVPAYDGMVNTSTSSVKALSPADIKQLVAEYVAAAKSAKDIGCDGIEIHGAHGYLLCSFLSPATNTRDDEYGGKSLENRMRFPLEIVKGIRAEVGADFPISYRWSNWRLDDFKETKFTTSTELQKFLVALRESGVSIVHPSSYDLLTPLFPNEHERRTLPEWCKVLCPDLPVIGVGKVTTSVSFMDSLFHGNQAVIQDPAPILDLIENSSFDLLAVGRALISCPTWIKTLQTVGHQGITPFNRSLLALYPNL